jgi:hypothetical protein
MYLTAVDHRRAISRRYMAPLMCLPIAIVIGAPSDLAAATWRRSERWRSET